MADFNGIMVPGTRQTKGTGIGWTQIDYCDKLGHDIISDILKVA